MTTTPPGSGADERLIRKPLPRLPGYGEVKRIDGYEIVELNDAFIGADSRKGSWKSWISKASSWSGIKASTAIQYWKPVTLRAPLLLSFIFVSACLILALEILVMYAGFKLELTTSKAVVYIDDDGPRTTAVELAFFYLPTIIAVIYSMLWSWIDLDAKRLEAWFQLSRPEGASAEHSILLQYPFQFLAMAPISAFKRRHWSVFNAGLAMMIIFWIITPLQSAIFTKSEIERVQHISLETVGTLLPITNQTVEINTRLLSTIYGVSWLDQTLPAFTTREFATLPIHPSGNITTALPSEIWTTTLTTYSADVKCSPADITAPAATNQPYVFSNGVGCSRSGITIPDANSFNKTHVLLQMGYFTDALSGYGLAGKNCPIENVDLFLVIWARPSENETTVYRNLTASFCKAEYISQSRIIHINATDLSIVNSTVVPNTKMPLSPNVLNTTSLKYLLDTGNAVIDSGQVERNFSDTLLVEQQPRVAKLNVTFPVMALTGFALATLEENGFQVDDLHNIANVETLFRSGLQTVFALAFSSLTRPLKTEDNTSGTRSDQPEAIIMVRIFSILVECAIVIIVFLTSALWYISARRRSLMTSDPAAISDIMSLVKGRADVLEEFKDCATLTEEQLGKKLTNRRFKLRTSSTGMTRLASTTALNLPSTSSLNDKRHHHLLGRHTPVTVRPTELSLFVGSLLIFSIISGLAILIFLFFWARQQNGIIRPTSDTLTLTILENYLPTLLATILEPFWVVLARILCLLAPFSNLRHGAAPASLSIDLKYTSLPPQLVLLRALRVRHFVLALVCFTAMSTNVLAVLLSALLAESQVAITYEATTSYLRGDALSGAGFRSAEFQAMNYVDHFYISLANTRDSTPLPPFLDAQFAFTPFKLPPPTTEVVEFTALTTGFSINPNCEPLTADSTANNIRFAIDPSGTNLTFSTSHLLANGTRRSCYTERQILDATQPFARVSAPGPGAQTMEIATQLTSADRGGIRSSFCSSLLLFGWVRLMPLSTQTQANTTARGVESRFVLCAPKLATSTALLTVDATGRVLATRHQNASDTEAPILVPAPLLAELNSLLAPPAARPFVWHNNSLSTDYPNEFLPSSPSLLSPSTPLPPAASLAVLLAPTLRRLAAAAFSAYPYVFADLSSSSEAQQVIPASQRVRETRIFLDERVAAAALALLLLQLLTAVTYYAQRPARFLPRLPGSVASLMAFVVGSWAVEEQEGKEGDGQGKGKREGESRRYAYGRAIGVDGRPRIGIERSERVVLMSGGDGDARRRRRWWKGKGEKEAGGWL